MLSPDYPIRTERLLLRPFDPATDVDAVYAYHSRPDVCRYVPFEPRTREQTAERIVHPQWARATLDGEDQALNLAVVLADTGQLVGDVMLFWRSIEHRSGELGYAFNPDFHGHGYATEASAAILDLAFDGLRLHRVAARVDERNPASAAVLRRLGMRQEGVLVENEWFKGEWSTEVDYAILDREWAAARGSGQR